MNIQTLQIISDSITEGGNIPVRYSCQGDNVNPTLYIHNIPERTKTLAVIMEDPDAPGGVFTHWTAWNLPPDIMLPENKQHHMSGLNGSGKTGYIGPCPPSGTHRYYFHVFALDAALKIENGADRKTMEEAMKKHILAKGSLMGKYKKISTGSHESTAVLHRSPK
jgi:Raf kinase inhibitor-like YbhB/YbcL family protein